jgi:hypothetical protein
LKKTFHYHDAKQIALGCLYLACKVEEMPSKSIEILSEKIENNLKQSYSHTRWINFNSESKLMIRNNFSKNQKKNRKNHIIYDQKNL